MSAKKKNIYFLGIGGIGMSALARFYKSVGYKVFGYDLTSTPLTDSLIDEGMILHFNDSIDDIPEDVIDDKDILVVYTPAIPKDHPGFLFLKDKGYNLLKRSEILGKISMDYKTIAIAGTHGKTTTTAIAAHILKISSISTISFIGGLMSGYESNILLDDDPELILVEADEYDRSFLRLHPDFLGVTSIDADHLDIYSDKNDMVDSFKELAAKISSSKNVIVWDNIEANIAEGSLKYGFSDSSDIQIISNGYKDGFHQLEVKGLVEKTLVIDFPMPGNHNALNAVLASSLCLKAGCKVNDVIEGIRSFQGVKRRFEYIINDPKCIFIDDYAHHPKEIDALIDAVRQLYPNKKITGIFQPHLYSRTRDFASEFAESLSRLDKLYLLDIYPAREKPIPGINAEMLLNAVNLNEKSIVNKENLPVLISSTIPEILLTIGAGDISQVVDPVKQAIINSIEHL